MANENTTNTVLPFKHMPPPLFDDPYGDEWTQPFWDAAKEEVLTAPRCTNCQAFRLPPSRFCPHCRHREMEFVRLPGTGTVFSFIVVRHPLNPQMSEYVPYMPAVVDPDGAHGCRFVSNVVDCEPEDVAIGMPVRVVWHHVSDTLTLPFWTPA
jgi:uncharacterized OB-fold protein